MRVNKRFLVMLAVGVMGLVACSPAETVKIGLVAPFDGRYREIGYDVIPAARLAVREWAAMPQSEGLRITLVSYDDMGDVTLAVEQAEKLAADPAVAITIGHWRTVTTEAAAPVYTAADIPLITMIDEAEMLAAQRAWQTQYAPDYAVIEEQDMMALIERASEPGIAGYEAALDQFGALTDDAALIAISPAGPPDAAFRERYEQAAQASPGLLSLMAYRLTWQAIEEVAADHGITVDAPIATHQGAFYGYQWEDDTLILIEEN